MATELLIYKASAGSGKTFRLAVEYIKLLIENPKSYRDILAVTFTNKATTEMKQRVLGELLGLSCGFADSENYMKIICSETGKSSDDVRKNALKAISFLIHNYNNFDIETIDSFFQKILRNMARELGLNANFNVDMNDDEILQKSVALMIEKANEDKRLMNWLKTYIEIKLEENKSWKIDRDIVEFCGKIFSEDFKLKEKEIGDNLNKNALLQAEKQMRAMRTQAIEKMKKYGNRFFEIIAQNGINPTEFKSGERGISSYFNKLVNENVVGIFNKTVQSHIESEQNWVLAKSPQNAQIVALAASQLMPLLIETEKERKIAEKTISTCNLITDNIYNIGLFGDILARKREINDEENRFLLSDTSALLAKMVGSDDSSFIFEKIGATLQHIMIDEFQDTSRLQWKNFEPLLVNCLSQAQNSLIVGDVKQAIYRWRNGDWRILNQEIETNGRLKNFNPRVETLNNSWRSAKKIVEFNNEIFPKIVDFANNFYKEKNDSVCSDLLTAYTNVNQNCKSNIEGFVSVNFVDEKDDEEYNAIVAADVIQKIEQLQDAGVKPTDIAILVRKNKQAQIIAEAIAEYKAQNPNKKYCYNLISSVTFQLNSSLAILAIIDALKTIADDRENIARAELAITYQQKILCSNLSVDQILANINLMLPKEFTNALADMRLMPLYELVEKIFSIFNFQKLGESSDYMFTFLDGINEYLSRESSDIPKFIEYWENTLSKTNINTGGNADGITIMTVHKSKGLEFHTVIVPFCDWALGNDKKSSYLWASATEEPYSKLGSIPLKFCETMQYSAFADKYKHEIMQLYVDNINVLYVALTRAKNNLMIIGRIPAKNPTSASINDALYFSIGAENISRGNIFPSTEQKKESTKNILKQQPNPIAVPFVSYNYDVEFKQSNNSRQFVETGVTQNASTSYMDRGKLLHCVFAEINSITDIDKSLEKLCFEGIITENDKYDLKKYITETIIKSHAEQWYSGKYKLYNECSIISKNENGELETKRPDRVMINGNNATVVDFKFGKQQKKYNAQIDEYVKLLENMQYQNVCGYLWYVDENIIESVKL